MKLLEKIFENIQFKDNSSTVILKAFAGITGGLIITAFIVGQLKMRHLNKLDNIEALAKQGIEKTDALKIKLDNDLIDINNKIDGVYNDGITSFNEYREFNNEQFKLVIEYGDENKELLMKMLDINSRENAIQIKSDMEISKSKRNYDIQVKPLVIREPQINVYVETKTGKKLYEIIGASKNYLDTLNLNKFEITKKMKNVDYVGTYDFEYIEKLKQNNNYGKAN